MMMIELHTGLWCDVYGNRKSWGERWTFAF